jgi:hypothetical protein
MVHQCVQGAAAGFVSVHMFVCAKVTVATLPDKRDRTSRNKGFGFLPQMAFAPDLARTGAKRGH